MHTLVTKSRPQVIAKADPCARIPLTPQQRGLWLLDQLHPGSSAYNVPLAVRLTGAIDTSALAGAVERIAERHQALRTTMRVIDGELCQHIGAVERAPLRLSDLSSRAEAQREQHAQRLVDAWAHEPFDLAAGPLMRARVIRLADDDHILVLVIHHIVCDGQSLHLFFDELAAEYAGEEGPPPPTVQYADYAVWRQSQSPDEEDMDWWRRYLDGVPAELALPTDHPRPARRTTAGATHVVTLPKTLADDISALARSMRLTPFMVSLTAYAGLLGRLTGAEQLLVATPLSGRVHPELEPLIGFFVNALPVRADLSRDPTFADLLARMRTSLLDVLAHQHVPFEAIVDAMMLERSPSHTPLMQTMFTYEERPLAEPRLRGVRSGLLTLRANTAKFDLDFMIVQAADGSGDLEVAINYATDLFDAATIERLAGRFHSFLAAAVATPDLPLRSLPLLTDDEQEAILARSSAIAAARADDVLLDDLFTARVVATPDAPAVSLGTEVLTYAELDARAERLARQLGSAGVGPDDVVGLLLPKGMELVTAVLGTMKSGAAYLPLDPSHPPGHIAGVLATARAEIVVTDAVGAPRLRGTGVEALSVDPPNDDEHRAVARSPRPHPDNLAYVIFTSGSTGQPKGVGVSRRALANHAQAIRDRFELRHSDRVLQFANIAFDVAAEEMFPTWLAGGCVVLCDAAPAPQDLLAFMTDAGVTVANLPSSYWQQWAAMLERDGELPDVALRLLVVGSESVDAEALETWRSRTTVPVLNAYGLTETAITAVVHVVDKPVAGVTVPIGRPIDGVEAYVLDCDLQLVPPGVQGELYIGGVGLARGYLERPDLTAERFMPHPFSAVPGARLHRTGDRARWRSDGVLEVLGRVDEQLKVRGHRIEPAEVEAALCSHPAISQAVVVAYSERLIGYVVGCGAGVVPADLRAHVASRLPAYLVPNALVALDALPTSLSGKLDRRRLPAPGAPTFVPVAPAGSDLERDLAAIWQRVLGVSQVGLDDNFFDLGGSSFTLATVHAQVCDAIGQRLAMVTLYEYPTVAALARHLTVEAESAADVNGSVNGAPGSAASTANAAAERVARLRARRARTTRQRRAA